MNSIIFRTMAHIVATIMVVFSVHVLLRGHNDPGGGFIAALISVIAFALMMIAETPRYVRERLHYPPLHIAQTGLVIMIVSGLAALVFRLPFLSGLWWKDIVPIGTPLLFDLGVYLGVMGSLLAVLLRLDEEIE